MRIVERFIRIARGFSGKPAVIDPAGAVTYGELLRGVDVRAHYIRISTTSANVGILLPTGTEFVLSFLGAMLVGKTPVPLAPTLSAQEIGRIAEDAGVDLVLTTKSLRGALDGSRVQSILVERLSATVSKSKALEYPGGAPLAALLYTSGSTGRPKGVQLSNFNLLANVDGCRRAFAFDETEIVLGTLPLFHAFALTTTMLLPLLSGATAVYLPRFDPGEALAAIGRHRVTIMMSIPSIYRALVARWDALPEADLSSLRRVVAGGEPLAGEVARAFREKTGLDLLNGYGLTEASPVVSVNALEGNRPGTVGRPLPNVEVVILDESGERLPAGHIGEIAVRGRTVMEGYRGMPAETSRAIDSDGYLHTADLGMLDEEGFLTVQGRKSDLIIVAGENVFPAEIEQVLATHPDVVDVCVIGVADKTRGEMPRAFVVSRSDAGRDESALRELCRGNLARHKVPGEIVFLDEMPKTATGKLDKQKLRSLSAQ